MLAHAFLCFLQSQQIAHDRCARSRVTEAVRSPRGARILGIFTSLMTALAAGAVWCVLVLFVRRDLIMLAPLAAIAIAWVLRSHAFAGLRSGALIAIVMTVVACA